MKKRLIAIITITLAAVLMLGVMNLSVFADDIDNEEEDITTVHVDLKGNAASRTMASIAIQNAETTSIDFDDPTKASASIDNDKYGTFCEFTFKKEGRVYVTHNYMKNGQECTLQYAYDVIATTYTCPVKSLKIGKTNLTKKLGHSQVFNGKPFKGKVTFKAKKGWKFQKMYKYDQKAYLKDKPDKNTALKKGKTITLKKDEILVIVFKKGSKTSSISYKAK